MSAHDLCAFLVTSIVLLVLPGPAVVYVVSQTARLGLGRGVVSALGVECGTLVHAAAATVGLSALLARSEPAFAVVRWAGVAYLVILGWRQLRVAAQRGGELSVFAGESRWAAFRQGFVVEVLNPKTALFFLAFLPSSSTRRAHITPSSWASWVRCSSPWPWSSTAPTPSWPRSCVGEPGPGGTGAGPEVSSSGASRHWRPPRERPGEGWAS